MDSFVAGKPPKRPQPTSGRTGDHDIVATEADGSAASEFIELNAGRTVDAAQDESESASLFETFDLAMTETGGSELTDARDAVLTGEVIVRGGSEVGHVTPLGQGSSGGSRSFARYGWRIAFAPGFDLGLR
jgi:hypothetical protein